MKYIEGKKYKLHSFSEERELSIVKKNGLLYICEDEFLFGTNLGGIWLSELYEELKVVLQKDGEDGYCYAIAKKTTGRGVLIEIGSRDLLIEFESYEDFIWSRERTILTKDYPKEWNNPVVPDPLEFLVKKHKFESQHSVKDSLLVFLSTHKKNCSIFSVREGFCFGPYNYETIDEYNNGFIVDNKYAIDKEADFLNISFLTKKDNVYYNNDAIRYYFFDDFCKKILHRMPFHYNEEENYFYAYYRKGDELYIFDTRTNEVEKQIDYPDPAPCEIGSAAWSFEELLDASDIAFEGYSALELGLD